MIIEDREEVRDGSTYRIVVTPNSRVEVLIRQAELKKTNRIVNAIKSVFRKKV
jgi:hypothetical protein